MGQDFNVGIRRNSGFPFTSLGRGHGHYSLSQFAQCDDSNHPFNIMLLVRVGGTLLYAMFAALGGYWLYFFNTQKVKAQFRGQQSSMELGQAEVPGLPSGIPGVRFGQDRRSRPLGLLKLKSWGLYATIALQCLALLNLVMMVAVPANRLRYQQILDTLSFSASGWMYHPASMSPMWIGMLSSLALIVVILFFPDLSEKVLQLN